MWRFAPHARRRAGHAKFLSRQAEKDTLQHKSKSVGFFAIPLLHSRARKVDQHYLSSRYPSAEIAKRRFLQVQWCLRLSTCPCHRIMQIMQSPVPEGNPLGTDLLRRPICKRAQPHNEEVFIINRNLLCIPLATCRLYARATRAQEEAIHLFAEIINKP